VNPPLTPFDIARGDSVTIHLAFNPATSGSNSDQLQIQTNADINPLRIVDLTASTKPIDAVTFRLEQEDKAILAGDTATFAVIPDIDWSGRGLQSIKFSIIYNGDILTYNQIKQIDQTFQTFHSTVNLDGNTKQLNIEINSPTEIVLHKDMPLLTLTFSTALTDTIFTPVTMTLLQLNSGDTTYSKCILTSSSQDADFVLQLECGSRTLLDFLKGKMPILTDQSRPNPVTSESNYQATLPFTSSITGIAEFECFDALGKVVYSQTIYIDKPGKYIAHFDGSKISSGSYEYVLRFKDNGSNAAKGHIIVLK
jgi:hypothetical protein